MKQDNKYYQEITEKEFNKQWTRLIGSTDRLSDIDLFTWYELKWFSQLPFQHKGPNNPFSRDSNYTVSNCAVFNTRVPKHNDNFWNIDWSGPSEPPPAFNWRESSSFFYRKNDMIIPLVTQVGLYNLVKEEKKLDFVGVTKGSDDWFFVKTVKHYLTYTSFMPIQFYKCDGFAGVKKLILNKLNETE